MSYSFEQFEELVMTAVFPGLTNESARDILGDKGLLEFINQKDLVLVSPEQRAAVQELLVFYQQNRPTETWADVTSSNVKRVGYRHSDQSLLVEFHSGSIYAYSGVSFKTYDQLRKAESVGRALTPIKATRQAARIK